MNKLCQLNNFYIHLKHRMELLDNPDIIKISF